MRAHLTLLGLLVSLTVPASEPPPAYVQKVVSAIYVAEGGARARVPYGILSVKVRDHAHARQVCENTVRANWRRWEAAGRPVHFIQFLGSRYAPIGAENDPRGLNRVWVRNVSALVQK